MPFGVEAKTLVLRWDGFLAREDDVEPARRPLAVRSSGHRTEHGLGGQQRYGQPCLSSRALTLRTTNG